MIRNARGLWITALLVLAVFALGSSSFNLENRLPIYKFDKEPNSYFGYSVAIHHESDNNKKW